jgi:hypothetical protein
MQDRFESEGSGASFVSRLSSHVQRSNLDTRLSTLIGLYTASGLASRILIDMRMPRSTGIHTPLNTRLSACPLVAKSWGLIGPAIPRHRDREMAANLTSATGKK